MRQLSGYLAAGYDATDRASACEAPFALEAGGVQVGLLGAAIWRGETVSTDRATQILNEIATRYRDVGAGVLEDLHGPFAISILEATKHRALLAVDRMGIERLTYSLHNNRLVFDTSADAVARRSGGDHALRHQAVFNYLFMHMVPAPGTVYEGISKIPPATVVQVKNGSLSVRRYWEPSYDYASGHDFDALKNELHSALASGVRSSRPDTQTGAFLSGGLDSSSVTGALAATSDGPTRTFTVGFGDTDYDELKFAQITNRHFSCESFVYQMTAADIVEVFPKIAAAYDEPFGNSSAAPTYFCARLAAENGVNHLLAGDGGDELFGGNERYLRQPVFESYFKIPRFLRSGVLEPITRLISPDSRVTTLRKLRSYVDQARVTLPERFETWNFMYREGRDGMLDSEFARSVDATAPVQLMREVWDHAPTDNLLDRMLWYDWRFTLADNDLRKVGTMSALAGVRVSYPLLHPDVVDLSLRVPPQIKIKDGELRDFFKRAMADFLPRAVIDKTKHGFGLPFGIWLKTDKTLADMIYAYLADLKKRHIVSADFIDKLIAQHRAGHPSYFGYAIWDLAMLEAWLGCHTL